MAGHICRVGEGQRVIGGTALEFRFYNVSFFDCKYSSFADDDDHR